MLQTLLFLLPLAVAVLAQVTTNNGIKYDGTSNVRTSPTYRPDYQPQRVTPAPAVATRPAVYSLPPRYTPGYRPTLQPHPISLVSQSAHSQPTVPPAVTVSRPYSPTNLNTPSPTVSGQNLQPGVVYEPTIVYVPKVQPTPQTGITGLRDPTVSDQPALVSPQPAQTARPEVVIQPVVTSKPVIAPQPEVVTQPEPARQPDITPKPVQVIPPPTPSRQPEVAPTSEPFRQPTVIPQPQPNLRPVITYQPQNTPQPQPPRRPVVIITPKPVQVMPLPAPSRQPEIAPTSEPFRQPVVIPQQQVTPQPQPPLQPVVIPQQQATPQPQPPLQPVVIPQQQATPQPQPPLQPVVIPQQQATPQPQPPLQPVVIPQQQATPQPQPPLQPVVIPQQQQPINQPAATTLPQWYTPAPAPVSQPNYSKTPVSQGTSMLPLLPKQEPVRQPVFGRPTHPTPTVFYPTPSYTPYPPTRYTSPPSVVTRVPPQVVTRTPPTIVIVTPRPTGPFKTEFQCPESNGFYAVANSCDAYFECKEYVAERRICPNGLYFNRTAKYSNYSPCAYASEVQCTAGNVIQRPQFYPPNNCPTPFGSFAINDGDCSRFIMCQEGLATIMNCPMGLVFNNQTQSCDWPVNVPQCTPTVFKDFTCPAPPVEKNGEISDVIYKYRYGAQCKSFVACQKGRPRLLSCDPGLAFDENSQSCISDEFVTNCAAPYSAAVV